MSAKRKRYDTEDVAAKKSPRRRSVQTDRKARRNSQGTQGQGRTPQPIVTIDASRNRLRDPDVSKRDLRRTLTGSSGPSGSSSSTAIQGGESGSRVVVEIPMRSKGSSTSHIASGKATIGRAHVSPTMSPPVSVPVTPQPPVISPKVSKLKKDRGSNPPSKERAFSGTSKPISARSAYQQRQASLATSRSSNAAIHNVEGEPAKASTSMTNANVSPNHYAAQGPELVSSSSSSRLSPHKAARPPQLRRGKGRQASPAPLAANEALATDGTNGDKRKPGTAFATKQARASSDEPHGNESDSSRRTTGEAVALSKDSSSFLEQERVEADAPQGITPLLSTFSPVWQDEPSSKQSFGPINVKKDVNLEGIICSMRIGETLAFKGIVELTVLHGAVRIGAAVTEANCEEDDGQRSPPRIIASSSSHPLPIIVASTPTSPMPLTTKHFPSGSTTLILFRSASVGTRNLSRIENVCPLGSVGSFAHGDGQGDWSIPDFHPVATAPPGVNILRIWPSWQAALETLSPRASNDNKVSYTTLDIPVPRSGLSPSSAAPVVIVRGPKRVGKSTLARLALDTLLAHHPRVAFLELDVGQPEFGPPGVAALHVFAKDSLPIIAPTWATARVPYRAHFVGDTTPRDDPTAYLAAVADLLAHMTNLVEADDVRECVPLVINTCGWAKGLGSDLVTLIEAMARPTHVFALTTPPRDAPPDAPVAALQVMSTPVRGLPYRDDIGYSHGDGPLIFTLPAAQYSDTPISSRSVTASDNRSLSLMAYFHSDLATSLLSPQWDFSLPLLARTPYVVEVSSGLRGGLHVLPLGAQVADDLKLAALNGSVVGVVQLDDAEGEPSGANGTASDVTSMWRGALSQTLPTSQNSTCLGLGIIRSIDAERGSLLLLTPVPLGDLRHGKRSRLALVKGAIDLPIFASLDLESVAAARNGSLGASFAQEVPLMAGVPRTDVPFISWPQDESSTRGQGDANGYHVVSAKKRKVRKNLMRRGQQSGK